MKLASFWSMLLEGTLVPSLVPDAAWDDPLNDAGPARSLAPRLAAWLEPRLIPGDLQHLRTTSGESRVVVEHVLGVRDGLVWNAEKQRGEKAERVELATAVVGQRRGDTFDAFRVYFGTWAVLDGNPRARLGPVAPDERAATKAAMDAMPIVRKYFDALAAGDAGMVKLFEPDGYFREPANDFVCGHHALAGHFDHILELGGVGIEFLTATREGDRMGLELQTVQWGKKKMDGPQAGFAIYELGEHGLLRGSRVYDSVVPP